MKYETVPTNTLKVGDFINVHGCMMRVREVNVSTSHPTDNGPTHANRCDYIGVIKGWETDARGVPHSWRQNWNEQGNSLARSCRMTDFSMSEIVTVTK